jgi:hypothetical protein
MKLWMCMTYLVWQINVNMAASLIHSWFGETVQKPVTVPAGQMNSNHIWLNSKLHPDLYCWF